MTGAKAGKRYARAFFGLAQEKQETDRVLEDLRGIRRIIDESDELTAFLKHPALTEQQQMQVLNSIFEGRVADVTQRFLGFLVGRRRVALLRDTCDFFEDLYYRSRGILRIVIECAYSLRDDQLDMIKERMAQHYELEIHAQVRTDENLRGGFRVRVGDTIHDHTIEGKLNSMRFELSV